MGTKCKDEIFYKAFDGNLCGRNGFQYTVGGIFTPNADDMEDNWHWLHYSQYLSSTINHVNNGHRFCEVKPLGRVKKWKCFADGYGKGYYYATDKIEIIKELSHDEVINILKAEDCPVTLLSKLSLTYKDVCELDNGSKRFQEYIKNMDNLTLREKLSLIKIRKYRNELLEKAGYGHITNKELKRMAEFYLKELFHNIPYIPCLFEPVSEFMEGGQGYFSLDVNNEYDEDDDELLNAPEYKVQDIKSQDGMIHFAVGKDRSWQDPLNKPKLSIGINKDIQKDDLQVIGVLLHELMHYYCWHAGYDFHDGSKEFDDKLREMGIPSNFDHKFTNAGWVDSFDYDRMDKYYDMYKNSIK